MTEITNAVDIDTAYDEFIDRLAKKSDDSTFRNSSEAHALSILRATFKYSTSYIYMLSNKLDPLVFNDKILLENAKEFLEKDGTELRIAIQDESFSTNKSSFLSSLMPRYENKIKVMKAKKEGKVHELTVNFAIADDKTYRLENDLDKKTAIGSFNDPLIVTTLKKLFESIFDKNLMTSLSAK